MSQQSTLIANLVESLRPVPLFIQIRQVRHFFEADPDYAQRVADGLVIGIE